jgi:hypothetical protein
MKMKLWHWAVIGGAGVGALLLLRRKDTGFTTVSASDGQYEFGKVKTGVAVAGIGAAAKEAIFVEHPPTGRIVQVIGNKGMFRVEVAPGWKQIPGRHTPVNKGIDIATARKAIDFSLGTQNLPAHAWRNPALMAKPTRGADSMGTEAIVRQEGNNLVTYGRQPMEEEPTAWGGGARETAWGRGA